eukprot:c36708_g1_i1.p1 GENE.c36708_g1_i1~~c36708_g1_i1.p1  ORF type:complete len:530 (-),score=38.90 c36708_g1_i1:48-1637(-)
MLRLIIATFIVSVTLADRHFKFILDAGSSGIKTSIYACGPDRADKTCPDVPLTKGDTDNNFILCSAVKAAKLVQIAGSTGNENGRNVYRKWLDQIMEDNTYTPTPASVYIGATAGNRIISADEDRGAWHDVSEAIEDLGVTENTIPGRVEAIYEFLASNFYPSTNFVGDVQTKIENKTPLKNIISLGGASGQIAVDLNKDAKLRAFSVFAKRMKQFKPSCVNQRLSSQYFGVATLVSDIEEDEEGNEQARLKINWISMNCVKQEKCLIEQCGEKSGKRCFGGISFLAGHTGDVCGRKTGALVSSIIFKDEVLEAFKDWATSVVVAKTPHIIGGWDQMSALTEKYKLSLQSKKTTPTDEYVVSFLYRAMGQDSMIEPVQELLKKLFDQGVTTWYAAGSFKNAVSSKDDPNRPEVYLMNFAKAYLAVLFPHISKVVNHDNFQIATPTGSSGQLVLQPEANGDWANFIALRYDCGAPCKMKVKLANCGSIEGKSKAVWGTGTVKQIQDELFPLYLWGDNLLEELHDAVAALL